MSSTERLRHYYTKVVGVTHHNDDGTSRQEIISRCEPLERLDLDHEEDNPVDPNAIAVLRENGEKLGHLRRELACDVVSRIKQGFSFAVFIKDLTGRQSASMSLGVNLLIIEAAPGVTAAEAQAYLDNLHVAGTKSGPHGYVTDASPYGQSQRAGCGVLLLLMVLATISVLTLVH